MLSFSGIPLIRIDWIGPPGFARRELRNCGIRRVFLVEFLEIPA